MDVRRITPHSQYLVTDTYAVLLSYGKITAIQNTKTNQYWNIDAPVSVTMRKHLKRFLEPGNAALPIDQATLDTMFLEALAEDKEPLTDIYGTEYRHAIIISKEDYRGYLRDYYHLAYGHSRQGRLYNTYKDHCIVRFGNALHMVVWS